MPSIKTKKSEIDISPILSEVSLIEPSSIGANTEWHDWEIEVIKDGIRRQISVVRIHKFIYQKSQELGLLTKGRCRIGDKIKELKNSTEK